MFAGGEGAIKAEQVKGSKVWASCDNVIIECPLYGTKYSRMDQVKIVEDSL